MCNLDDTAAWVPVARFKIDAAMTYADTRPGHKDRDKRERIRKAAEPLLSRPGFAPSSWGFRILVRKAGRRRFDIENVPKVIVDAFSRRQITDDKSGYTSLALYEDDTIDHVTVLEVTGERTLSADSTVIAVYARRPGIGSEAG